MLFLVAGMSLTQAFADSPWYPRVLLNKGDHAVLIAPEAIFNHEIGRMELPPAQFTSRPATDSYELQTADAERSDLAAALRKLKMPESEREVVLEAHAAARARLRQENGNTDVVAGLPGEFATYFRGSIAWRSGDHATARYEWESLLNQPTAERHFKSTWAAFMLGKLLSDTEPEKAIECFQQARALAAAGFADSSGLAASSVGWEARVHRKQGDFGKAIELYLEQHASGDDTALNSLRFVAREALRGSGNLSALTTNRLVRRVITAFAISDAEHKVQEHIPKWLDAVEKSTPTDADEAEMIALAAYRGGRFEAAQRWIKRAPSTAVTLWLQAKLHARAGKLNQALGLLDKIHPMFPEPSSDEEPSHDSLAQNILIPAGVISPRQHIHGEIAVLHTARRDYVAALDHFLHGHFWADAAYVAERVLTLDELQSYVDRKWPAAVAGAPSDPATAFDDLQLNLHLRHLLARRLARNHLPARAYFPDDLQPKYDELMAALKRGEDESLPAGERSAGWFAGAKLLKEQGLELIGTELEPDWHIHGGWREHGLAVSSRTNEAKVLMPSADELARARRHHADPEERFHYRYQAAFIALQAAGLLPDNSEEKAQILHTAGAWLKDRDPQTADIFYKHLVRRCRQTALGSIADVKRWFPRLDSAGNIEPADLLLLSRNAEPSALAPALLEVPEDVPVYGDE